MGVSMVPAQCQERAISTAGWASGGQYRLFLFPSLLSNRCSSLLPSGTYSLLSSLTSIHLDFLPPRLPHSPFRQLPDRILTRTDIHTLAQGGRLHSQMINANMRNLVPLLLDHGYARGDIDCLLERCLAEVSLELAAITYIWLTRV